MPDKKGRKTAKLSKHPKNKSVNPIVHNRELPIVGIGASAGGLEALKVLFQNVSEDSNLAYIVVVHLSPKQPSLLSELLQGVCKIPVKTAEDGQEIKANQVYILPPGKDIRIFKGKLQLFDILIQTPHHPIDTFLRSLALDKTDKTAAIILSGTGTDGTLGIREIKSKGGLVLVQSEKSASYDGMPRSAIGTGLADMILSPEEMPKILVEFFSNTEKLVSLKNSPCDSRKHPEWLNKIFAILRSRVDTDFSAYKENTICRRISRRMGLNQIVSHNEYVRFLRENPEEVKSLFHELLIGVTSFFRDAESFAVLKTKVLHELFRNIPEGDVFRIWVPGCSTGEEVYSLAITLYEYIDTLEKRINLQLFGTDIDERAINHARSGLYPVSIAADVSKKYLKRYFVKDGNYYQINNEIRDLVVFSVQDVLKDPPFSRLNLLCCRNLLIYFGGDAQKKVLPLFHYTLKPGGVLMLGSSESIGGFTSLFETLDKKWKIFRRLEIPKSMQQQVHFPSGSSASGSIEKNHSNITPIQKADIGQATVEVIVDQFSPPAVLVDENGNILHIQGRVGNFLEPPSGPPSNNILDQARQGFRIELSSALRKAKSTGETAISKGVNVNNNGYTQTFDLHVRPLLEPNTLAGRYLVVMNRLSIPLKGTVKHGYDKDDTTNDYYKIEDLEKELQINREKHQTAVEELESSNEELKSTNEELQSSNEELQSTNEELESSKEELQSLNEELQTINAEMQSKVEELSSARDDMHNIFNSTEVATVFVDDNLKIRRFTSEVTKIINLIKTDIGRPLEDVKCKLIHDTVITDLEKVLKNLIPIETEVQTSDDDWYKMRIMPYRTIDNRIDGAVITFTNIFELKENQIKLEKANVVLETSLELVRNVFDMSTDPLAVLDETGNVIIANSFFSEMLSSSQKEVEGSNILSFQNNLLAETPFSDYLNKTLKNDKPISSDVIELDIQNRKMKYIIEVNLISKDKDHPYRVLLKFIKQ